MRHRWVEPSGRNKRERVSQIVRSCARVRSGAHGQLPGGEGAQGKEQRKEGRQEVHGEEGETKEVTLGRTSKTSYLRRHR